MKNNVLLYFKGGQQVAFANPKDEETLRERIEIELRVTPESYGKDYEVFFLTDEELQNYSWGKAEGNRKALRFETGVKDKSLEAKKIRLEEITSFINGEFAKLDIEMIRSIEGDSRFDKGNIKEKKQFLRSLPKELEGWAERMGSKDWENKNPFNNIFDIEIKNSGAGYMNPPNVIIAPPVRLTGFKKIAPNDTTPKESYDIFQQHIEEHMNMPNDIVEQFEPDPNKKQARAISEVENGSVVNIKIIDPGYGYTRLPIIKISPPEQGNNKAVAIVPKINFLFNTTEL